MEEKGVDKSISKYIKSFVVFSRVSHGVMLIVSIAASEFLNIIDYELHLKILEGI